MIFRSGVYFGRWGSGWATSVPRLRRALVPCPQKSALLAVALGCAAVPWVHYLPPRATPQCDGEEETRWTKLDLVEAARRGDVSTALRMLQHVVGFIDEPLLSNGQNVLLVACSAGALPLVAALLDAGADPNAQDVSKASALSAACISGNTHVVKKLLERPGLNAETWDVNGLAPIHQAVGFGHPECIRCMLQDGLNPNLSTGRTTSFGPDDAAPERYETPLHIAARLLTRAINLEDGAGSTEHQQRQRRAILEVLVEHGADPLARDFLGDTPLHHCARYGDAAGLWLLLGNTPDAMVAAYARSATDTTVLDEASGAGWAVWATLRLAIQMHGVRTCWGKYWSVYEFVGRS